METRVRAQRFSIIKATLRSYLPTTTIVDLCESSAVKIDRFDEYEKALRDSFNFILIRFRGNHF